MRPECMWHLQSQRRDTALCNSTNRLSISPLSRLFRYLLSVLNATLHLLCISVCGMPNAINTRQYIVRPPRLPNKRSNSAITSGYFPSIPHPSVSSIIAFFRGIVRDIVSVYRVKQYNPPKTLREAQTRIEIMTGLKRSLTRLRAWLEKRGFVRGR